MKPVDVDIVSYNQVVEMFHNETDRGAAVLAASFLDNFLAKYVRSVMADEPVIDELFTGFGPFADFNKRIETAYALRLVSKESRRDLKLIQKIRNHFAHMPSDASFDTNPVRQWVSDLSFIKYIDDNELEETHLKQFRLRYLITVGKICAGMHNSMLARAQAAEPAQGSEA